MSFEDKVDLLIKYVKGLKDFKIVKSDIPYNHMGATITDAVLQAGTTWDTVVKPRIKKLIQNYPERKNTTDFLNLLYKIGPKELLDWNPSSEKGKRLFRITEFFVEEEIKTEADLKTWLENDDNIVKLKSLRGVKNKTADYFKILVGISTSAIDRHLIEFLKQADIDININNYQEAQKIINKSAEKMEIDKSTFDHSIWKYMSIKKNKRLCKKVPSR
jgi:endonuclease III